MSHPWKPSAPGCCAFPMRAARAYFVRHDYRGASLQRILLEADLPHSSFYRFFQEKRALFDTASANGPTLLAGHIKVADPGTPTVESYWPTVFGLVGAPGRVCRSEDLTAVPALFRLCDASPSAMRDRFEQATHQWCTLMAERGRALGKFERDSPADLHVELMQNMMVILDWRLATYPEHMGDSTRTVYVLLARMLKVADQ